MDSIDVNGRTIRQHPGTHFELKEVDYRSQLQAMLGRLTGEVGVILDFINVYNAAHKDELIGFFSLIRMLMPIVDALATLEGREPEDIFGELDGVPAPRLMWNLYRDMF